MEVIRNNIKKEVRYCLEIFVYSPTYFGLTAIYKGNINITGMFSQQLHKGKSVPL